MSAPGEAEQRLVDRYVDGVATGAEVEALDDLLKTRPEAAAYFASVCRLNAMLREHAKETAVVVEAAEVEQPVETAASPEKKRTARPSSRLTLRPAGRKRRPSHRRLRPASRRVLPATQSQRRRARRRRPLWVAVVAVSAAALAAVLWLPGFVGDGDRSWDAAIGLVSGQAQIHRKGRVLLAEAGTKLEPGDAVETARGTRVTIGYDDGTIVLLNRDTRLELGREPGAKHLGLHSGDVYLTVAPQEKGSPLVVNPGRFDQVAVVGTVLEVSRRSESTVLRVAEGQARFGFESREVAVGGGLGSSVAPGEAPDEPEPVKDEIAAWRRNRPPIAENLFLTTARAGESSSVVLTAADPDEDAVSYRVVEGPVHGELSGQAPELTYVPDAGYQGEDGFSYLAEDGAASSLAARVSITVSPANAAPTARIQVDSAGGAIPFTAVLRAGESSDPDGRIVSYRWDFGDGEKAEGAEVEHLYEKAGAFVATLTVTDDEGAPGAAEVEFSLRDPNTIAIPGRPAWHYDGKGGSSVLSWEDNSDNEEGFYIECAREDEKGAAGKLVYERIDTVDANQITWRLRSMGGLGWHRYRVVAFNKTKRLESPPSRHMRLEWMSGGGVKKPVRWPPPSEDYKQGG